MASLSCQFGSNKSKLALPVAAVPAAEKLIIRNVGKFASAIGGGLSQHTYHVQPIAPVDWSARPVR